MLEPGVARSGINHRRQSQLVDAVQALKKRMLYDIVQQSTSDLDKPENWVVDDFVFRHFCSGDISIGSNLNSVTFTCRTS